MRITLHKLAILPGLFLSSSVLATDINVDFTATVKASTCNITLTGNNVTSDGNDTYTLTFPGTIGLDKIANKTTQAQANFNLVASGCTTGVSKITTKLSGNASGSSPALIIPSTSDTTSTTDYVVGAKDYSPPAHPVRQYARETLNWSWFHGKPSSVQLTVT